MKRALVFAVICLLLSGCAPKTWYRADTTNAEFQRDMAECKYQATLASPANPFQPMGAMLGQVFNQYEIMNQCLQLRGYHE